MFCDRFIMSRWVTFLSDSVIYTIVDQLHDHILVYDPTLDLVNTRYPITSLSDSVTFSHVHTLVSHQLPHQIHFVMRHFPVTYTLNHLIFFCFVPFSGNWLWHIGLWILLQRPVKCKLQRGCYRWKK